MSRLYQQHGTHLAGHLLSTSAIASQSTSESSATSSPQTPALVLSPEDTAVADVKPLAGMRVLVVDDERVIRKLNQSMLTRVGAGVDTAEDGQEVLPMVQAALREGAPYDAVLLDIIMARTNGDVACRQLREAGFTDLPVLAASGNVSVADVDAYLAIGFTDIIGKPFTVRQVVDTLLRLRRMPTPPPAAAADSEHVKRVP